MPKYVPKVSFFLVFQRCKLRLVQFDECVLNLIFSFAEIRRAESVVSSGAPYDFTT